MADPIIRIVIEEATPGGAPGGGQPSSGGGGGAPTLPKDQAEGGGDRGGGGEDDSGGGKVAKTIKAYLGRRLPGGQKLLSLLGLDESIDTIAGKLAPAIKRLSDTVKDFVEGVLGVEKKAKESGDKDESGKETGDKTKKSKDPFDFLKDLLGGEKKSALRPDGQKGKPDFEFYKNLSGDKFKADDIKKPDIADKKGPRLPADAEYKNPAAGAEGAEAAEGAAGGGLAAAAGPVAIAALALMAVGEAGEKAASAIRGMGRTAVEFVNNDPTAAMRRVTDGIIETVDKIPIVGEALTALPKVFLAVGDAAGALKDAFLQNARKLENYSGAISAAESLADVRHILADINEAQRTGPRLAQLVTLQSQIEVEFQRAMVPIKEDLLELLVPLVGTAAEMATVLRMISEGVHDASRKLDGVARATIPGWKSLEDLDKWIRDKLSEGGKDGVDDWNALVAGFGSIDLGAEAGVPAKPPPNDGFGGANG